jgi:restriction system protein
MSRRRKQDGLFDDLYGVFLRIRAWICVPLALVVFVIIQVLFSAAAGNPILRSLAPFGTVAAAGVALLILLAGFTAAISKSKRRQLYDGQTSLESIRALSWREFEVLIGEAYRRQGHEVSESGGGGADGEIDLVLRRSGERILVQCKRWKVYKVGVSQVRDTTEPCPICGNAIVLRMAKRGRYAGSNSGAVRRILPAKALARIRFDLFKAASAGAGLRLRSRFRR